MRSLDAARRADVALMLVDSSQGVVDQDLHVADEARKAGCATLVVLSKWDLGGLDLEDVRLRLLDKLRQRPPRDRDLGAHRPRPRAPARIRRRPLRPLHRARLDGHPEPDPGRGGRAAAAARRARPPAQGAVRRAGADAPAALPADGQRPHARLARLRLLPREPPARSSRAAGLPGDHRHRLAAERRRDARARRRRRLVGHRVRLRARAPRPRRDARRARPGRGPRDGARPHERPLPARRAARGARHAGAARPPAPVRRRRPGRARGAVALVRVGRVVDPARRRRDRALADEGARSRERRGCCSTCSPSAPSIDPRAHGLPDRPEPRRGDRRGAPGRVGAREPEPGRPRASCRSC